MITVPKYTKYALTNTEIERHLLQFNTSYLHYNDIAKYTRLIDLFENDLPFRVIFLENEHETVGHWVCLINIDNKRFEYFDSSGMHPDEHAKKWTADNKQYFKNIIAKSGEKLIYADKVLQGYDTASCGYWVINRINSIKLPMKQYHELVEHIKKAMNLDDWVVHTTVILSD